MTASLQARLERLENTTGGGGECRRCSGTTMVVANGVLESVTKHGQRLTPDEAEAFEREELEEGGRCPICGRKRPEVTVGSWG
jgi:hypothetical protein